MKFKRNADGQFETDIEIDFKNTHILKFVHNKHTIATYNTKTDKLVFRYASQNHLVDEKMFGVIQQALLMQKEEINEHI